MDNQFNAGKFTFPDRKGEVWDLSLTLLAARRVDNSDFSAVLDEKASLLEPSEKFLAAMLTRPSVAAAVAWAIVKPQADERQIDEDAFVERLDGQALDALSAALWGSLLDFFRHRAAALAQMRDVYLAAAARERELIERSQEARTQAALGFVEREISQRMRQLNAALGASSSGSSEPAG